MIWNFVWLIMPCRNCIFSLKHWQRCRSGRKQLY
nr:MAG TPA: hypothetical protein [Caudoviricetes sp.]